MRWRNLLRYPNRELACNHRALKLNLVCFRRILTFFSSRTIFGNQSTPERTCTEDQAIAAGRLLSLVDVALSRWLPVGAPVNRNNVRCPCISQQSQSILLVVMKPPRAGPATAGSILGLLRLMPPSGDILLIADVVSAFVATIEGFALVNDLHPALAALAQSSVDLKIWISDIRASASEGHSLRARAASGVYRSVIDAHCVASATY